MMFLNWMYCQDIVRRAWICLALYLYFLWKTNLLNLVVELIFYNKKLLVCFCPNIFGMTWSQVPLKIFLLFHVTNKDQYFVLFQPNPCTKSAYMKYIQSFFVYKMIKPIYISLNPLSTSIFKIRDWYP